MDRTCATCGATVGVGAGDKTCDNCWEVERRLDGYLRAGGERAQRQLVEALVKAMPPRDDRPLLYSIGPPHLNRIRTVAEVLAASPMQVMRDLSRHLMEAVRFAESLEALRGPGEPYVHLCPREP